MCPKDGRILVTGAGGWIGSRVCERLRSSGRVVADPSRGDVDWSDRDVTVTAIRDLAPATIVHLAASTDRGSGVDGVQWRDTFLAGRNVVESAADAGVGHVLIAGTMEELGDAEGVLTVQVPPRPRTTYGLCKSLLREVAGFVARERPMRIDWFRPTTVYGPGQVGPMLVPTACRAATTGEPARFTAGTQERDFLFLDDLVDWIALASEQQPAPAGELNVHHIGTGEGVRVADVLAFIADAIPGTRFDIGGIPRREGEPDKQVAPRCPSGDPVLGGWRASTEWRDGLRRTIEWWRSGGK